MINFKDAIELTEVGSYVDIKISGKELPGYILVSVKYLMNLKKNRALQKNNIIQLM